MAEPSLSELYSYTPRPELATGDRDVVPDNRAAIEDAIGLAQENNKAIQQRYALFQKAYADRLKAGQVDYTGVNPNHIPALKEKAAKVFQVLYKNPAALAGINVDPRVEAEFAAAKDDLEASIAASKKQYNYAEGQNAFMHREPEMLTDSNKKKINRAFTAPLGEFVPEALDLPTVIDYNALAKSFSAASKIGKPIFEPEYVPKRNESGALMPIVENGQVKVDANGQPVYQQDYSGFYKSGIAKETDFDKYMQNALSTYDSNQPIGKFNQPIQESVGKTYQGLPENYKIAIEDLSKKAGMSPERYFYEQTIKSKYNKDTDLSGVKEVPDQLYKQGQQLRNDLLKMKTKYGYDWNLAKLKLENQKDLELWKEKNGLRDVDKGGEALNDIVVSMVGDALSKGVKNRVKLINPDGSVEKDWFQMEVPTSTLDYFKVQVPARNSDGKELNTSGQVLSTYGGKPLYKDEVPVGLLVDEGGNKVKPIFSKNKSQTTNKDVSNDVYSQPFNIDQLKQRMAVGLGLEKSLDASNRMLTRIPGFEFPTLNGKVKEYIQNRSAGNYNPDKGGGGKSSVTKTQSGGGTVLNGEKGVPKNITFKGRTYSQDQVEAAAKKSGMTTEEYIKALNGQ